VPPDQFISVAEDSGLMRDLGRFIIERTISDMHDLQTMSHESFYVSINLSVKQLFEEDFLEHLVSFLETKKYDHLKLTLEITESIFIEDLDYVLPILKEIRERGINISLDDFGTGFSSLSMLRQLPINELKIDKSFVDDILINPEDKALTKTIIDIAKNLNMKTVAEGTEEKEQVAVLSEMECDVFQGYYFSKPLNKDDLFKYILKEHLN
jgi:diguanylate cyclase